MSLANSPAVWGTLWHSPTLLMVLARSKAHMFMAIGLTYCKKVTSGHNSSMSLAMSSSTGMVRSPRMMPPMPRVSAMVWRRPYFLGISKSTTVLGRIAAHLEHGDGVVGPGQGFAPIRGGLNRGVDAQSLGDLLGHDHGGAQPFRVDVVQADGAVGQLRVAEDIPQQILGKDGAARTDKGDFWHRGKTFRDG